MPKDGATHLIVTALETPRGEITIRPGQEPDWEQYRALRLEMLRLHPEAFLADYETTEARHASYWREALRNPGVMSMIFFALHEQQLVGMAYVQRRGGAKQQNNADIFSVYVKAEWRGLRIADALLERCALWAKRSNISILKLSVVNSNAAAIRCYERCGFVAYGTEPQAVFFDGKFYDDVLMARPLTESE